ncbi:acyltransferase family protein [Mycobacterium sp. NPDC048908]|uniref:acyltransferase family protein n=1 Tax=Mycobacterium sp. NPDC048908 TaxID=3364292 RepID=UPI0037197A37
MNGIRPRPQFRPDIEGMRAIAVALVILFHAYHQPFTGGFVGVDVFFVISGFLITSLLLKERGRTGRISIRGFYARRVRRILPASTLVVLVTVFATYGWLGFIAGNNTATDAEWTAIFAANIHFGLVQTDYFGALLPPSPLQHMWSLGVEEQFYLVWPAAFLVLVLLARTHHRKALCGALSFIVAASLIWSMSQTALNQTWAYFSPLTRAWELGLGALVAVLAPVIAGLRPAWLPQALAFAGLTGIILAAVLFTSDTRYPGSAAILPVVGSAVLIAAGCANERSIVGRALSVRPMQWVGARSYSMYLWHWPLLVIPALYATKDLSALRNTGLVLLTVLASAITYQFVENPIRRSKLLAPRTGLSLAIGVFLVGLTIFVAQWQIAAHYGTWNLFS